MRSAFACPDAVFSLLPLKTATFARLPRATLLTRFFFIALAFIAGDFMAFIDFIAFMADFITDFIGKAILKGGTVSQGLEDLVAWANSKMAVSGSNVFFCKLLCQGTNHRRIMEHRKKAVQTGQTVLHLHSVAGLRVLMCRSLAQPPCRESICQSSVLKSNVADLNNPAWIDDGTNHARPWEEMHRIGQLLEKNCQDFLSNK